MTHKFDTYEDCFSTKQATYEHSEGQGWTLGELSRGPRVMNDVHGEQQYQYPDHTHISLVNGCFLDNAGRKRRSEDSEHFSRGPPVPARHACTWSR